MNIFFKLPNRVIFKFSKAFSLIEMLMALLVASLLLAALAPVMTRRMNENMHITGDFDPKSTTTKKEIIFGSTECPADNIKTAEDGSEYCEGTYKVPDDYTGVIRVTVIGAGGGGGTAPTAGLTEFKEAGSTNIFTVPAMVNKLEATLISGGAGGGAGGQVTKTQTFVTSGNGGMTANSNNIISTNSAVHIWNVPQATRGKYVSITACGGGGGGGGVYAYNYAGYGGGGGSGGYLKNKILQLPSSTNLYVKLGGGGGGGAMGTAGLSGGYFGGGGGASSYNNSNGGGTSLSYSGISGGKGASGLSSKNEGNATSGSDGTGEIKAHGGNGGLAYKLGNYYAGNGGNGGILAGGGGGGSRRYDCGNAGGGGGGGGPTTLTNNSADSSGQILFQVGGGGGGGGGSANTGCLYHILDDGTKVNGNTVAGGGGGAGGGYGAGGGGGGGGFIASGNGGTGGGALSQLIGSSTGYSGKNGASINNAIATLGYGAGGGGGYGGASGANAGSNGAGIINTIFGNNYCNGGNGALNENAIKQEPPAVAGVTGNPGAMQIKYIDYGSGGSGGGAGQIVPIQPINVIPKESLKLIIGQKNAGGSAGLMEENGTIKQPTEGRGEHSILTGGNTNNPYRSELYRENTKLLSTTPPDKIVNGWGTWGGSPTGQIHGCYSGNFYGCHGYITNGKDYREIKISGFSNTDGKTAGNGETKGNITFDAKTIGGDGGILTTPWFICTPGKGGTASSPAGKDAQGFGCGGGGGYGLANGGKGSGGYARLSWNKHWDAALNSGKGGYKLANSGTGGGGATGNIMTYSIKVMGGQVIRIRIGKGGKGAEIINNSIVEAKKGGDTIFGDDAIGAIRAGGGFGGGNPSVTNNSLINGLGGNISSVCHFGTRSYLNNKSYCTKGIKGFNAEPNTDEKGIAKGANGASLVNHGEGGEGGISGTSSYLGNNAKGVGSGGGGAGIYDLGDNSISPVSGTNKGGIGSNGKIIIELYND